MTQTGRLRLEHRHGWLDAGWLDAGWQGAEGLAQAGFS